MDKDIQKLKSLIAKNNNIVFFGGAGVSTESGIPDFRSENGLFNQKYKYSPEEILSHTFFMNHMNEFYDFYKERMNSLNYEPNITHLKLTELEASGKLKAVITQNIDGLHSKAGTKNVLELHGSILRNYCIKCNKFYSAQKVFESREIPKCGCRGFIKPDVVLYEEPLDDSILNNAINYIKKCDLLIVAGTSLSVYPANGLINYFCGKDLVLINKDITPYDNKANLVIHKNLGEVFKTL